MERNSNKKEAIREALKPAEAVVAIPGLPRELHLLHITDSHLTLSDGREPADVQEMAAQRTGAFAGHIGQPEPLTTGEILEAQLQMANELKVDSVVLTGDIIDFPSAANLDRIGQLFAQLEARLLYTVGNHDWCFPHQPFDDQTRLDAYYRHFGQWSSRAPGCEILELDGVGCMALDDSNYQVTEEQFAAVRERAAQGPCLLFMHIPLYIPALAGQVVEVWRSPIMLGAEGWEQQARKDWGVRDHDPSTIAFRDWLYSEDSSNIKAIFCGHVHFERQDEFRAGAYHYITRPGFAGGSRRIKLVAE